MRDVQEACAIHGIIRLCMWEKDASKHLLPGTVLADHLRPDSVITWLIWRYQTALLASTLSTNRTKPLFFTSLGKKVSISSHRILNPGDFTFVKTISPSAS